jgi:hypothetical protein
MLPCEGPRNRAPETDSWRKMDLRCFDCEAARLIRKLKVLK